MDEERLNAIPEDDEVINCESQDDVDPVMRGFATQGAAGAAAGAAAFNSQSQRMMSRSNKPRFSQAQVQSARQKICDLIPAGDLSRISNDLLEKLILDNNCDVDSAFIPIFDACATKGVDADGSENQDNKSSNFVS